LQTRTKTPAWFLCSHIVRARPDFIGAPCPRGQHDGLLQGNGLQNPSPFANNINVDNQCPKQPLLLSEEHMSERQFLFPLLFLELTVIIIAEINHRRDIMLGLADVLAGINMVLIIGSFFLSCGIIFMLREGEYVLAKGWKYILPAVLIFAVLKVYDFFDEYSLYSGSRLFKEGLLLLFSLFLFVGLLVQYLAIKKAVSGREG
jgi:hypothetical protein